MNYFFTYFMIIIVKVLIYVIKTKDFAYFVCTHFGIKVAGDCVAQMCYGRKHASENDTSHSTR